MAATGGYHGECLVAANRRSRPWSVDRFCPGGRVDRFRGWIIPSIVFFPQTLAIAELASSMPVNGSFYWWTGALAPPKWSRIISFTAGWLNVFSMFTATAAFAYALAASLAYSINMVNPDFPFTNAQLMAMSMAVFFLWLMLMLFKVETIGMVYVIIGQSEDISPMRLGKDANLS